MTTPQPDETSPPRKRRPFRLAFVVFCVLAIAACAGLLALSTSLPGYVQRKIVGAFSADGVAATCGDVRIDLRAGRMEADALAVSTTERGSPVGLLGWKSLRVQVDPWSLLSDVIKVRQADLEEPFFRVEQRKDGFSFDPIFAGSGAPGKGGVAVIIGGIGLHNGRLVYVDRVVQGQGVTTTVDGIVGTAMLHHDLFGRGSTWCSFDMSGRLLTPDAGKIRATGTVHTSGGAHIDIRFEIQGLGLKHIDPYCGADSAVRLVGGTADVSGNLEIGGGRIHSRFMIELHGVRVKARDNSVNSLVFGLPTQAAARVLMGRAAELPIVVEVTGDLRDPDFVMHKRLTTAIASAFAARLKHLGSMGLSVLDTGVEAGKAAAEVVTDAGKKITGKVGEGLELINPFSKKRQDKEPGGK